MPFIPVPYLMTLPLHRYDYSESNNYRKNKPDNRKEIKEETEKTKSNIPSKCLNCSYRFYEFCSEKRENISNLDKEKINQCREMDDLWERRKLLKESKWTPINKLLLRNLLSGKEIDSVSTLIYNNLDQTTARFEVWELLSILSFSEEHPVNAGKLVTYDDYFKTFDRYLKYIIDLEDGKIEPVEKAIETNNNSCDYATLILLKNFLSQFQDNENVEIIQEMLTKRSSIEDITTAINLLFEEGLLSIDIDEPKNKVKMYQ